MGQCRYLLPVVPLMMTVMVETIDFCEESKAEREQ